MKTVFLLLSLFATSVVFAKPCIHYSDQTPFHITRVDLNCPNVQLIGSDKNDNGTTVSDFAAKHQTDVAINANFFWKDLTPIGLVMSSGKRWSKYGDTKNRVIFACNNANQCWIEPKDRATPYNLKWQVAIEGWHWFNAKTGKFECAKSDNIGCVQSIFTDKHPRTMIGLDETKNWLYFVVVEGRQLSFRGVTLDELGILAKKLGLTQAVNLDGGGSSTMIVGRKRANSLPILQNEERKVANHLGVKLTEK